MDRKCNKCGNVLNENGLCEICLAREETAATAAAAYGNVTYSYQKLSRNESPQYASVIWNKVIFILSLLCIMMILVCFFTYNKKNGIENLVSGVLPQNQTSGYVLGQYKEISELQVLKINKADFYTYKDKKRSAELIIRYYIKATFDLNDAKVIKNNDNSIDIEIKKPAIEADVLDDSEFTKDKSPGDYPGVEIFSASQTLFKCDFEMGDYQSIAKDYMNSEVEKNRNEYEKMAISNLKYKLIPIMKTLGLNISDVIFESGDQNEDQN